MRLTVELPDGLYRQAKEEAMRRGCELKDLIGDGLRLVVASSPDAAQNPSLSELMKPALGLVESGVPDLASNAGHLQGFARALGHR